jgi:hypothetical protein
MKVKITGRIRNNSGNYSCPINECWLAVQAGIPPLTKNCPTCGIELDWSETVEGKK